VNLALHSWNNELSVLILAQNPTNPYVRTNVISIAEKIKGILCGFHGDAYLDLKDAEGKPHFQRSEIFPQIFS
jgi:hypothetical protein